MQPPKSSICVICATRPATTMDHVPPRGFFKGVAGQFRTVPACAACNNGSSGADEELRNYISAQVGKPTEAATKLWTNGAFKSLQRSVGLRNQLRETLREVEVVGANGESIKRLAFTVPNALYQRVFERITRGLHFFHIGQILRPETRVVIEALYESPDIDAMGLQGMEHFSVADGAFDYRFAVDLQAADNGFWLFTVHNSHWVMAVVGETLEEP